MTIDLLKQNLITAAEIKDAAERVKAYRGVLTDAIDYIYESTNTHKPEKASLLELVDSDVLANYVQDSDVINSLHYVRILGMNAEHDQKIKKTADKLAYDNLAYFIGLIEAQEKGTRAQYQKPPYMSEANTRKLYIDLYLKEAGWDVLDTENVAIAGKAGIEIKVEGMPNAQGIGFCDYVLYGRDGKPLAIVEAKKTSVSPEKGRHQVDLYGECMKAIYGYKPILYYTNGYVTKVIDGIYPDRTVMAFLTIDELELMMQRRNRGNITDLKISDRITNRPYQKMAITNLCEWLNQKHRRGLLVMATGTGKTRVAISLVDVLSRNNWVKNVLFLADRTSLVNQAKKNFAKLLPNMSICELSGNEEKDYNARLMFCTYQTMINYIDAEDKRFTSGRFDLIIIDEAHRSIFNKYGSIFAYFDSLLVGLTATPKSEVDANTYRIFGCESGIPNFDYSLQLVAVFGSALVFYNLNKSYWGDNMIVDSIFNIPPELFVYMLVFFILGFLIYAFMFGAVGSTASKLEDINTSVMPITMLFIIAFFVVMFSMASGSIDNTLMTVCSYIPFTSPMAMFTRICMSTVPLYEILISVAILIGSTLGIGFLAAKIYRVGVLMYGTTPKLGAILKAVWKA